MGCANELIGSGVSFACLFVKKFDVLIQYMYVSDFA